MKYNSIASDCYSNCIRVPWFDSVDVEVLKANEDALIVIGVEEIMAGRVTWIKTGKVGRREAAVG